MKKIVILSLTIVLLACCVACAVSQPSSQPSTTPATEAETPPITTVPATTFPLYADELTDARRQAIIDAINMSEFSLGGDPSSEANRIFDDTYYLGTYNGYDIFMTVAVGRFGPAVKMIGNEFLGNPNNYGVPFSHHQGIVEELIYPYNAKAISEEDLHTAAQKWFDIVCQLCGEDEVRSFYADYGYADRYE